MKTWMSTVIAIALLGACGGNKPAPAAPAENKAEPQENAPLDPLTDPNVARQPAIEARKKAEAEEAEGDPNLARRQAVESAKKAQAEKAAAEKTP